MDLLFKTYSDTPPRIGITCAFDYLAINSYELLLSKGKSTAFHLELEIIRDKMKLVLTSEENGYATLYQDVDFKPEQARKLMEYIQGGNPLQFVHIYKQANNAFVAKPFKQQKFITIVKTNLLIPGHYGDM